MFEVAPSLFMVELRKKGGDTLEYHNVRIPYAEVYSTNDLKTQACVRFSRRNDC